MHSEGLMKPDLLSDIALLCTGEVIFLCLALIIAVALARV